MTMETAGSLAGGQRIWGLARIGESFTLAGGDRVEGYLLLCSPHKQGEAFTIKLTAVRVVCNNTLTEALGGSGATFRMSHWHEFDGDMQQAAAEALGLAKARLQEMGARAEVMAQANVSDDELLLYIAQVSGMAAGMLTRAVRGELRSSELNKTGKLILDAISNSPGADLPSARGTMWGALNGVTYAIDHQLGRTDDSRMTSAWFGVRGQVKKQAENLAFDTASAILARAK